nr:type II toxin-antitoxin system HicB family antitoxin [uncultured Lamprocystis sp.]
MLYPVYVHPGDADHAHGVTIPDFPGCFSAAAVPVCHESPEVARYEPDRHCRCRERAPWLFQADPAEHPSAGGAWGRG